VLWWPDQRFVELHMYHSVASMMLPSAVKDNGESRARTSRIQKCKARSNWLCIGAT
jgi:hypothetical protein